MRLLDTIKGAAVLEKITISAKDLEVERRAHRDKSQCCAMYRGRTSAVFCLRHEGHDGSHRGDRKQWSIQAAKERR